MAIAPLSSRLMEDRLRVLETRLAVLERRTPTGDGLTWPPVLAPGTGNPLPTYTAVGNYIRTNNILHAWAQFNFTSAGSTGWTIQPLYFDLPYAVDEIVNGFWVAQNHLFEDLAWGPCDRYSSGEVVCSDPRIGTTRQRLSNRGLTALVDLPASLLAGALVTTNIAWDVGYSLRCLIVGRIPDGS